MKKSPEIKKTMTIQQILDINPNHAEILTSFGLHCLGCPFSRMESLEQAAEVHGFDVDELVKKLNNKNN